MVDGHAMSLRKQRSGRLPNLDDEVPGRYQARSKGGAANQLAIGGGMRGDFLVPFFAGLL